MEHGDGSTVPPRPPGKALIAHSLDESSGPLLTFQHNLILTTKLHRQLAVVPWNARTVPAFLLIVFFVERSNRPRVPLGVHLQILDDAANCHFFFADFFDFEVIAGYGYLPFAYSYNYAFR